MGGGKVRVVGERERERGSWVRVPLLSGGVLVWLWEGGGEGGGE